MKNTSLFEIYNELIDNTDMPETKKTLLKNNWIDFIFFMERLSKRNFIGHSILNIIIIVLGTIIPVIANLPNESGFFTILISVFGLAVSISAALNQFYKFNDRWKHFRSIAEETRIEGEKFLSLCEIYKEFTSHDKAFKLFSERLSHIKEREINDYFSKTAVQTRQTQEVG